MTAGQWRILSALLVRPQAPLALVASAGFTNAASASACVRRLRSHGLVEHRGCRTWAISPKGRALLVSKMREQVTV